MAPTLVLLLGTSACTPPPLPLPLPLPLPAPAPAPAPADSPSCTRRFAPDADLRAAREGTATTIDRLIATRPTSGLFTVEGFVQIVHHCAPCPTGAACKPCEDDVWVSPVRGAYKGALSPEHDLHIYVHDASKLEMLGHYRLTLELCTRSAPNAPLPDLELRGYRPL